MAGIYIHFPFCKQACYYCDFHFSTDTSDRAALVQAMSRELILQTDYLKGEPVETIYLGGGTPSLLSDEDLDSLLHVIRENYNVIAPTEITLEANPDDLSLTKSRALRTAGVNRLSIGVQSFDNQILELLHRAHDVDTARNALGHVREAGFDNMSIDLIYGIPGLTEKLWGETLKEALNYSPEHISTYALTIEERTVFGNWHKRGKFRPADEELSANQLETLMDVLAAAGYIQYEISNFCKPGFPSRHNSSYWNQSHYLGIGPSAHSYNGESRQFNVRNNAQYLRALGKNELPFEREVLTRANRINEYILTSLRTVWGCDLKFIEDQWHENLRTRYGDLLTQIQHQGLATLADDKLRLTRKGKLLADQITSDLIIPA